MQIVGVMLIALFVSNLIETITWPLGYTRAAFFTANAYALAETVIIISLYRVELNTRMVKILPAWGTALIAIYIYQFAASPGIFDFPRFSRMALSFSVIIFAIMYFYKLLRDLPAVHVYKVPMLWINIGLLIYFTGTLMLLIVKDYMIDMLSNDPTIYWGYHNFLAALSYMLYSIGLLQVRDTSTVL
jgi:hypothetical protein